MAGKARSAGSSAAKSADRRFGRRFSLVVLGGGVLAVGLLMGVLQIATDVQLGTGSGASNEYRPWILIASLMGLSSLSYVAWPSRWNLPAHASVAFGVVAYVIPIGFLGALDGWPSTVVDAYYQVVVSGFTCALIGALVGARVGSFFRLRPDVTFESHPPVRFPEADNSADSLLPKRVMMIAAISIAALCFSFVVMGFIPALASDPFSAKFFRGAYGEAYKPVAPLYRAATSALALFIPLVGLYAWKYRSKQWIIVLGLALSVMILTLQRGSAVTGVLLFVGAVIAARRRGMPIYFLLLMSVYAAGSAVYYILGALGIGAYTEVLNGSTTYLQAIAAGAPDVQDHLTFLRYWLSSPEYTLGRTFWGGLVPGNFEWNPSLWTLAVTNPGAVVTNISSGGLRLPAPIWGLVSFSWPGVVAVSTAAGFMTGILARIFRGLVDHASVETAIVWLVVYGVLTDVLTRFYTLSYLSIVTLGIVLVVLRVSTGTLKVDSNVRHKFERSHHRIASGRIPR